MYSIQGTKIQMTRGDTLIAKIDLAYDGEPYTPTENDSIRFALKHDRFTPGKTAFVDDEPVLVKTIPYDTMLLEIEPNDTKALEFGNYIYDIEITFSDGRVDTFIAEAKFVLKPEVH